MSEKCPIIAIDPGNRQSAYCVIDCNTLRPLEFGKVDNEELRNKLVFANEQDWQWAAIEMVASYGMAVNDPAIRRALIDRFATHDLKNGKGTSKNPDFFYGFKADIWAAYAVGLTAIENHNNDYKISSDC